MPKIQWNRTACQSVSKIQLGSLGFSPTTRLCVRQSMSNNGSCRTIPEHLSTLPLCTGCKEHPINCRDQTDNIELFSKLSTLVISHQLLQIDSARTMLPVKPVLSRRFSECILVNKILLHLLSHTFLSSF